MRIPSKINRASVALGSGRRIAFMLVLLATIVVTSGQGWAQPALADSGGKGHTFEVTFTKWVTSFPQMLGVVGGDVGNGVFAGEILDYVPGADITHIEALYHFKGSRHSFTAHVFVTQNNLTGLASITGRVTEGWLEDAEVTGEYKVWNVCPIPTPGNAGTMCFQGTLDLRRHPDK